MEAMPSWRAGTRVSRETVIEIVAYIGAAAGVTAAGIALGESAGTGVQAVFNLITAAVLFGAGWALVSELEVYRRMKSVFWFLSVFAVAGFAGVLFSQAVDDPKNAVFLTALVVAVYSFGLWLASRRSLQVIALVLSVYVAVATLLFPDTVVGFDPPDLTALALVTWIFGLAVVAAGALGVLSPRKTTMAIGSVMGIVGPLLFLVNGRQILGELLSLGTAVVLVAVGGVLAERVAVGVGIAGLLLLSAVIVANHVEDQGPAILVVVIGLLLLGGAIVAARAAPGSGWPAATTVPPAPPPIAPADPTMPPPMAPPAPPSMAPPPTAPDEPAPPPARPQAPSAPPTPPPGSGLEG